MAFRLFFCGEYALPCAMFFALHADVAVLMECCVVFFYPVVSSCS